MRACSPVFVTRRMRQRGFTLLELSIALVVIGIVVAGGLSMSTSMVERQAYVQTGNQMDEIDKALDAYVSVNKHLPCPAEPTLQLETTNFGKARLSCNDTGGIAIGMLPIRTLGLRDRYSADEYGNRYTYAVTSALTTTSTDYESASGKIIIRDTNDAYNIVNDAAYVVVSHGSDGKGAYRYETATQAAACNGGKDSENCDGNGIFRNTRFNRGSVAGNWFDDTVRFRPKRLINMGTGTDTELWKENGADIYNTNTDNVGIGTANPLAKLGVNAPTGIALDITSKDAQHTMLVHSISNESGLTILTNSSIPSDSLRIDHVGTAGTGAKIMMNNVSSTGLRVDMFSTGNGIESITGQLGAISVYAKAGGGGEDQTDKSYAMYAVNSNPWGYAVYGENTGTSGPSYGVYGKSNSSGGSGVNGVATGSGTGVFGTGSGEAITGVAGVVSGDNSIYATYGVRGENTAINGAGVRGLNSSTTGGAIGVSAEARSSAGYALHAHNSSVTGNAVAVYGRSDSPTGFGVYCAGPRCGGTIGWNEPSDMRLKDHIVSLDETHGLEAIRKLRPVTYSWKDITKRQLGTQLGFIAQEVEAIFPELVLTNNDLTIDLGEGKTQTVEKSKSMTYATLTVPLVRAVQQLADGFDQIFASVKELITRVDGHDAKIAALENANAALKADNAALTESNAALNKRLDAIEEKLAH